MFPQNSETVAGNNGVIYDEGTTTAPGSGGTGNINATALSDGILEQEDGGTSNGDPVRQYNLVAKFWSPGTITYNWAGAPSPGNAFKLEAYGAGTVGGTSTGLESGMAACILVQPATTCTAVVPVTGSDWTGINVAGKAAAFFARDNTTHSTLIGATLTLTNPGQVVIHDLTPGIYNLIIGAFNCGTFTVVSGDNSIYCKTTSSLSGAVLSLNNADLLGTGVKGPVAIKPGTVIH